MTIGYYDPGTNHQPTGVNWHTAHMIYLANWFQLHRFWTRLNSFPLFGTECVWKKDTFHQFHHPSWNESDERYIHIYSVITTHWPTDLWIILVPSGSANALQYLPSPPTWAAKVEGATMACECKTPHGGPKWGWTSLGIDEGIVYNLLYIYIYIHVYWYCITGRNETFIYRKTMINGTLYW